MSYSREEEDTEEDWLNASNAAFTGRLPIHQQSNRLEQHVSAPSASSTMQPRFMPTMPTITPPHGMPSNFMPPVIANYPPSQHPSYWNTVPQVQPGPQQPSYPLSNGPRPHQVDFSGHEPRGQNTAPHNSYQFTGPVVVGNIGMTTLGLGI